MSLITRLMTAQTEQPSCTSTTGQDANPSEHNFVVSTISSLFSPTGPAGDWLKLVVIGGILELMRRAVLFVWRNLVNQFWITVVFEEYNDSYCEYYMSSHLCEPNDSWSRSLDDDVVIQTARVDASQGAVDQQQFVRSRIARRPCRGRSR